MTDWLKTLNPQQYQAVTKTDGPLLVIAGAGSGKTRVITYRISYLIQEKQVAPWNILAVTFTNKAASEMKERVARITNQGNQMRFSISTFHSICAGILRRDAYRVGLTDRFTICDETDQKAVIKDVMRQLKIEQDQIQPGQAQHIINQAKMRMLSPEDIGEIFHTPFEEEYVRIYQGYQDAMKRNDACDFEDLIGYCVQIFEENEEARQEWSDRWPYILVDEYQDTNLVQFRFLENLARDNRNLCVVGDEDQSIYSWRGADIHNLLDFQKHFPEADLIRLEQNYRSYGNILDAASLLIESNRNRIGKKLWTERGKGAPLHLIAARSDREESMRIAMLIEELHDNYGLPYREIAIFYRTNALSRILEDRMREWGLPYRVIGGVRFYDRKEIKDLISYLRIIINPNNELAMLRIINTPRRGIGQKTIDSIQLFARLNQCSMFQALDKMVEEGKFKGAAKNKISAFSKMIHRWRAELEKAAPTTILERVIADTDYLDSLGDKNSLEAITRQENIEELKSSLLQFEKEHPGGDLNDYLELVALASAIDKDDSSQNSVSLMTMHAAKGLEFSVVFICALDNGIFPNMRALEEGNVEEERRLFYVGLTRAKDMLVLSRAESRFYNGRQAWNQPSMFLKELPKSLLVPAEDMDGNHIYQFVDQRKIPEEAVADALEDPSGKTNDIFRPNEAFPPQEIHTLKVPMPFQPGDAVRHPLLGVGEVISIEAVDDDHKVNLFLEDGSEQTVYVKHARLELI